MVRRPKAELPPTPVRGVRKVADLTPYANNARTHTAEQIEKIAASMRRFGFTRPVLIDENDGLIAGHGRILAAEMIGLDEVPVDVATGWTPEMIRAYVIADNRLAEDAGWDDELLRAEIAALEESGFDLSLTGFEEGELEAMLKGEEDDEPEPEDETPDETCAKCGRTIVPDRDLTRRAQKKRKGRSTTITTDVGGDSRGDGGEA